MNYTKVIPSGSTKDSASRSNPVSGSRTNTRSTLSLATTASTNTSHTLESIAASLDLLTCSPGLNTPTNVSLMSSVPPLPQRGIDALATTAPLPSSPLLSPYATNNETSDSDFDVLSQELSVFPTIDKEDINLELISLHCEEEMVKDLDLNDLRVDLANLTTCDDDESNVNEVDSDDESSTISQLVDCAIEHNDDDDDYDNDDNDDHYESYYQQELHDPSCIIEEMTKDKDYFNKNASYLEKKNRMIRNRVKVKVGKGNDELTWVVRYDIKKSELEEQVLFNKDVGVYGFNFNEASIKTGPKMNKERIDLSDLLLHLFPGEIQHLL